MIRDRHATVAQMREAVSAQDLGKPQPPEAVVVGMADYTARWRELDAIARSERQKRAALNKKIKGTGLPTVGRLAGIINDLDCIAGNGDREAEPRLGLDYGTPKEWATAILAKLLEREG